MLGFEAELTVCKDEDLAAQGYTCQWYQLVITEAGEVYVVLEGETSQTLNVTYPLQAERYYCIYKVADGSEKMSEVFVLVAQTTDLDEYLTTLYTDYYEIVIVNEQPIADYAAVACDWMERWNVTLADGTNLAQNVLAYWYEYPDELLCSCVISGAVAADGCILGPDAEHDSSCGWYVSSPALVLEEKTTSSGNVYYTLSVTVDGETTIIATTEMLDGEHHYFKDVRSGIFVAWLYTDENGGQWVVPLKSEN